MVAVGRRALRLVFCLVLACFLSVSVLPGWAQAVAYYPHDLTYVLYRRATSVYFKCYATYWDTEDQGYFYALVSQGFDLADLIDQASGARVVQNRSVYYTPTHWPWDQNPPTLFAGGLDPGREYYFDPDYVFWPQGSSRYPPTQYMSDYAQADRWVEVPAFCLDGLSVSSVGQTSVTLSGSLPGWSRTYIDHSGQPDSSSDYNLYRSAQVSPADVRVEVFLNGVSAGQFDVSSRDFTITVPGLAPGTGYAVKARLVDRYSGEAGPFSGERSFVTVPATPAAPSGTVSGLGWSSVAGRGRVELTWQPVQGATGYRVWVFDGYAYRAFDVGNRTSWDSHVKRIYPSEAWLDAQPDNSLTADPFNHVRGGEDLRDDPNKLYRKTAGSQYDSAHGYWFRVSAYNASGESPMSEAFTCTLPNRTDPVPPAGTVKINDGAAVTGSVSVTLSLAASDSGGSGLTSMQFSNDSSVWSPWYPYSDTYSGWSLAPGEGTRTVYVRFRDAAGNVSDVAAAQIYLRFDMTPPEVELRVNGGAEMVSSPAVTLTLKASDDATATADLRVRYSHDGQSWTPWEPFAPTRSWTLLPGEGPRVVYVQVRDGNGNIRTAYALTNLLSSVPGQVLAVVSGPGGGPLPVPAQAARRLGVPETARLLSGPYVRLALSPPAEARNMRFSFNGVVWQAPEPVGTSKDLVLPPGDGPRAVWVQFGTGRPVGQELVVDGEAPRLDARWLGDAAAAAGGRAVLVLDAQDNLFLPSELELSLDGGATWQPYRDVVEVGFSAAGYQVVRVGVRDPALNAAWKTLQIYNP